MDAGIPEGATRQREYPDLGTGVRDGPPAGRLRNRRGMGFGDDEGHEGDETSTRRRDEKRGERYR